jgi:hypothetical protein
MKAGSVKANRPNVHDFDTLCRLSNYAAYSYGRPSEAVRYIAIIRLRISAAGFVAWITTALTTAGTLASFAATVSAA